MQSLMFKQNMMPSDNCEEHRIWGLVCMFGFFIGFWILQKIITDTLGSYVKRPHDDGCYQQHWKISFPMEVAWLPYNYESNIK